MPSIDNDVQKAKDYIDSHVNGEISLKKLASIAGVSPFHLQRKFTATMGLSPKEYQDALRLSNLKKRLKAGDTVGRATYEAGYSSSRAVYTGARAGLGMTPGAYRRGGQGLDIKYTIKRSPLGNVLVAATDDGVCALFLGDSANTLVKELRKEFPNATLIEQNGAARGMFKEWVKAALSRLGGQSGMPSSTNIPLDLQGTEFQQRVWQALQKIPAGETRSYGELAAEIGAPKAVRAVGTACGSNNVAVLVPCHRVVRSDGSLGGFRWDVKRKQRLLEQEKASQAKKTR